MTPRPPSQGLAIASLVLGLLAVLLSPILLGGLLGLIGVVLALIHLSRQPGSRVLAGWGAGLSSAGVVASILFVVLYVRLVNTIDRSDRGSRPARAPVAQLQGVALPPLALTNIRGQPVDLAALKGRRVVLDFWATWCGPCRKEIPHLVKLAQQNPKDLVVIGISEESEATLLAFGEREGIPYDLVSSDPFPRPFDEVHSYPTTVFIDREGVIRNVLVGYNDFEELSGALE